MHRGRFGGNARKRKAKLTDRTFEAMIGGAAVAEAPLDVAEEAAAILEVAVEVGLPTGNLTVLRPAPAARGPMAREFRCQDYVFGYAACGNCHNDQVYYIHQNALAAGYTFRCRICRMEMTVSGER